MQQKTMKLSDAVKDSIIVVTNDIHGISGEWVAAQYQADDLDEGVAETVPSSDVERLIVSEEEVIEVINHLGDCHIDIANRPKNRQFMRSYDLTRPDVIQIVKQLTKEDYTYSLASRNQLHLGSILTVFITGKAFMLNDGRVINNPILYIKVDDSSEGLVTIVSIHESERPEEESHPYAEEFKKYENLWD